MHHLVGRTLYLILDLERRQRNLSWRALTKQLGLPVDTLKTLIQSRGDHSIRTGNLAKIGERLGLELRLTDKDGNFVGDGYLGPLWMDEKYRIEFAQQLVLGIAKPQHRSELEALGKLALSHAETLSPKSDGELL
ncbi:MAG: hypothetical protein ACU0CI_14090 [Shimia sp.]